MSIIGDILKELWNTELNYKGMRVNIFGIPTFKKYNRGSLHAALSRMNKNGLIQKELQGWVLTSAGKKYIKRKADSLQQFSFDFPKDTPRNMLVMFDIPELKKGEREWFRWHLKKANYLMIQKSVWVGPSPLPKEFLEYLKKIKLGDCIKIFKLAKGYKKT